MLTLQNKEMFWASCETLNIILILKGVIDYKYN